MTLGNCVCGAGFVRTEYQPGPHCPTCGRRPDSGTLPAVIVYHADCPDGFCGALILKQQLLPDAELWPATYGQPVPVPELSGRDIVVVDFSWSRDQMLALKAAARSLTVLDHHKTAEAELAGLDFCEFDMGRSGAQMAWDYAERLRHDPGQDLEDARWRPWFVDYVADRDLWRWELPDSKAVNAYLATLPHEIEAWRQLDAMTAEEAARLGAGARAQIESYVRAVCAQAGPGFWKGHRLSVVNAAYPNISDVAHELCQRGADVGIGWFVRGDGMIQFSLRSQGELDVSVLAKEMGGGGHRNAAGFQVEFGEGLALLEDWNG